MKINKKNYEAYLLDLWEGHLSEVEKVMLYDFFDEHPELNDTDALNLLGDVSSNEPDITFDKAAVIFDEINVKNHEFFFIAYNEGDLSREEMIVVDDFLKENPSLNKKFAQFSKAKLPEETILYPNKEKLIAGKSSIISMQTKRWYIAVAAASVAIMIMVWQPFENVPYKYTMTPVKNLKIEKISAKTTHNNVNPPINKLENKLIEQIRTSFSKAKKDFKHEKSKSEKLNKLTPSKKENINPIYHRELDKILVEDIEIRYLSNNLAVIIPTKNNEESLNSNSSNSSNSKVNLKKEIPTLFDLTASYLQSKNVLNKERKPDLKGILNSTLSNVNANNEPILVSQQESNTKRTIFQFGGLKVERIAKN